MKYFSRQTVITISFQIFIILFSFSYLSAQENKTFRVGCISFYNVENLFDTVNDITIDDEEFLPDGRNNWTPDEYSLKLDNMAKVISEIGTDYTPDGPAILGLSEIENKGVIEDLISHELLIDRKYKIVHYDSPDRRGVDVGLIYQPKYFTVLNSKSYCLYYPEIEDFLTRDQLVVSGLFDNDTLHIIVNHWPSRRGGEKRSRPMRIAAARLNRHIVDSLVLLSPNAKIIVMGDLNDNPTDYSVRKALKTYSKINKPKKGHLYNPTEELYKKGIGTSAYRDTWSFLDQIIVSQSLTGNDFSDYKLYKTKIFKKKYLLQKEGRYKGYPHRTFAGGVHLGGYSDHFPIYILIVRETD